MSESAKRIELVDNVSEEGVVGHTVAFLIEFLNQCNPTDEIRWCPTEDSLGHPLIVVAAPEIGSLYIAQSTKTKEEMV